VYDRGVAVHPAIWNCGQEFMSSTMFQARPNPNQVRDATQGRDLTSFYCHGVFKRSHWSRLYWVDGMVRRMVSSACGRRTNIYFQWILQTCDINPIGSSEREEHFALVELKACATRRSFMNTISLLCRKAGEKNSCFEIFKTDVSFKTDTLLLSLTCCDQILSS